MGHWDVFDHTADVGLTVHGGDLDDVFQTAAEAVFDYVVSNRQDVAAREHETLILEADTPVELLVAWLSELLFRCETRHVLYRDFRVKVDARGRRLEAEIAGEPIDRERHVLDHEVKAVTRHDARLDRDGGEWVASLVLDI